MSIEMSAGALENGSKSTGWYCIQVMVGHDLSFWKTTWLFLAALLHVIIYVRSHALPASGQMLLD